MENLVIKAFAAEKISLVGFPSVSPSVGSSHAERTFRRPTKALKEEELQYVTMLKAFSLAASDRSRLAKAEQTITMFEYLQCRFRCRISVPASAESSRSKCLTRLISKDWLPERMAKTTKVVRRYEKRCVHSWLRETLVSPLSKGGGLKTPALRSTACFDRDDWDDEYRLHAGSSIVVLFRSTSHNKSADPLYPIRSKRCVRSKLGRGGAAMVQHL